MASFLSLSLPKLNLIKASSATNTTTTTTLPTAETLNEKFGRKGIKFLESDNIPIVELTVRNGSSLRLRIPDAHVTSYKPKVNWKDDGFQEVLYTIPATETGPYKAKGGVGLVMNEVLQPGAKGLLPSTLEWTVNDVDSDSIDALQVELSCTSRFFDITYIVTLYPVSMATAVVAKNIGPKPATLTNAILSHFRFKKRGGTAIQGLRSCSYIPHAPPSSPFQILTPSEATIFEPPRWLSFGNEPEAKPGTWGQQALSITLLENKMSRVYAALPKERLKAFYNTPPSKYETIDQASLYVHKLMKERHQEVVVAPRNGTTSSSRSHLQKQYVAKNRNDSETCRRAIEAAMASVDNRKSEAIVRIEDETFDLNEKVSESKKNKTNRKGKWKTKTEKKLAHGEGSGTAAQGNEVVEKKATIENELKEEKKKSGGYGTTAQGKKEAEKTIIENTSREGEEERWFSNDGGS